MSDDNSTIATWWTPGGWLRMPEPAAYTRWRGGTRAITDFGYGRVFGRDFGVNDDDGGISGLRVYACYGPDLSVDDEHLYVLIWGDVDCALTHFFVQRSYEAAFVVDVLPQLIAAYGRSRP